MGENSSIEWTDHTFNPWWGCQKVSPGCDHCYAETVARRYDPLGQLWEGGRRLFGERHWREPLRWNERALKEGVRRKVFAASMADVFDNHPDVTASRARLWQLIRATPQLDWLILTKRISNVPKMLPEDWSGGYPNVWLGISVVNQEEAERDVPRLAAIPARVRFLSCEPLLGPIRHVPRIRDIHWMIVGGESGYFARILSVEWAFGLLMEAHENGLALFMKQGSQRNWPDFRNIDSFPPALRVREFPNVSADWRAYGT